MPRGGIPRGIIPGIPRGGGGIDPANPGGMPRGIIPGMPRGGIIPIGMRPPIGPACAATMPRGAMPIGPPKPRGGPARPRGGPPIMAPIPRPAGAPRPDPAGAILFAPVDGGGPSTVSDTIFSPRSSTRPRRRFSWRSAVKPSIDFCPPFADFKNRYSSQSPRTRFMCLSNARNVPTSARLIGWWWGGGRSEGVREWCGGGRRKREGNGKKRTCLQSLPASGS